MLTHNGWHYLGVGCYLLLTFGWSYLAFFSVKRFRGAAVSSPFVARVYLALLVGSSCGIAASIYGIFSPPVTGNSWALLAGIIPLAVNIIALCSTLPVITKGWLPQIASDQIAQRSETENLRTLVDARTEELRAANLQLERDIVERKRAEENLRAEHALLDTVVKTSVGAICVLDTHRKVVFANESAQTILGVSVGDQCDCLDKQNTDLEGRPLQDAEHPFRRIMNSAQPITDLQHCIAAPDGTRRILSTNGAPLKDSDGAITGAVFLVTDVTQRKHDEELLRNSEKRFRTMVENLPGGAVYVEGDKLLMNRAAERITGYLRTELTTVQQWFWALYAEESRNERENYEALRKAGFVSPYVSEIRQKNGERRTVECEAYQSENATIWLLHDVTERFRAEEALRASELKYRLLAENAVDIICIHDLNGKISYANEAGLRFASQLRKPDGSLSICDVLMPDAREKINEQRARRMAGDYSRWLFEVELVTSDGQHVPFELSSVPIVIDGKFTGNLSVARDISERRRAESERAKLEARIYNAKKLESLGQLAGGISNDFNNILMGILGSADLAWHEMQEVSAGRQYMEEIFTSVKRASELCKHLVAYTGKDRYPGGRVDLNALIGDMLRISRVPFQEGIKLDLNLSTLPIAVEGESAQLGRALINLLANACEALDGAEGVIAVSTGTMHCTASTFADAYLEGPLPEGSYNFVTVADTGAGMDDDTVQRMFDPFFSTKARGRGLGLSDVLGIVRAHGGTLTVTSKIGQGTAITLFFPALPASADLPAETHSDEWRGSGTILLVDDEENVRSVTKRMLSKLGFDTLLADTGTQALELIAKNGTHLSAVILDLALPDMDIETAFMRIREALPGTPVVLTSGYSPKNVSDGLARYNVAGFLAKPFLVHELAAQLRNAIENTPQQTVT